MRSRSGLAARIARIEAERAPPTRRRTPSVIVRLYDVPGNAITALRGSRLPRIAVDRRPGETLAALTVRARALIDEPMMMAVYPEDMMRKPEPARKPAIEPDESAWDEAVRPWGESDIVSLAGIGRTATKVELVKMGIAPRLRR